ncbi:uncharacterized protein LOC143146573 isoform X2 [Ptiloglossa arizonensis]|uniref:uncharacterized protein LOC143146573 isoform X2 n=1 Tax=Ptiloglossa arizonensis TaxID=3350558 RepID=UPI003FA17F7D
MEISPRKLSKRAQEPVDEWLQNEGYFRKHAPRDPTCLFRAVSEQIYMTQYYHIRVRKKCVEFMRKMKHLFEKNITIPFDDYLEQMACFTEWGGMNEIQAMSLLFKREFIIFNGQMQIHRPVTNNGFKDTIYLCYSPQKQYDTIYTREVVATAAYCQSIVYQILYKDVFQMPNVDSTVHKMLHDRSGTFRHDRFFLKGNLEMRDQLAAEIYSKIKNGHNVVDDTQAIVRDVPPFPYRVAKALDPNIYRNTDFDIWHEIRREVKNAGWTKHNSHELQVGGTCLVQMEFNEEEFDKVNNNNVYVSSFEKDTNGNDTKALQKKSQHDPVFFYGHIQEMSKNQGPVLVFIEELGEKKIVPYSALKPLPPRKNKQNNWLPMCKRNVLDSNQKWKKTCSTTLRKSKQSVTNENVLSSNINKNQNNDNSITDVNRNNFQWKEQSLKVDHQQTYENYRMKNCPDYLVNNPDEMFSTKMILNNTESSAVDNVKQENSNVCKENNSLATKCPENNLIKNLKSDDVTNIDNNVELNLYSKQRIENDNYYLPYTGETVPDTQVDDTLCSINCSVQKSVDVNGSDLPLSDPFTLRFFYNLGLEYFRESNNWNYLTNGQSTNFGQWYQGISQNEEEMINITNGVMQNCTLMQQKREDYNDRKEISIQSVCQENGDKRMNDIQDMQIQKTEVPRGDNGKDLLYLPLEKIKEQESINRDSIRINRNGLGPRFKKNSDNRPRNAQQFIQPNNQYLHCGPNSRSPKSQETKDAVNSYQTPYMQPGMYSGLSYYANETDSFTNPYYPPSPGFFPVPCLPHSDIPDNSGVQPFSPQLCPGIDYAQAYSGLCPPYICSQPASYSIPPQNMQEHWYAVTGQPHYMQYAPILPMTADTTCNGMAQNANQNISSQNI